MPMRTMHRVNGLMFQDLLRYEKEAREMTEQKDVLAQCAKRPDTDQIMAVLRKVTTGHLYRDLTCERWKDGIDITVPTYAAERLAEEFAAIGALTPAASERPPYEELRQTNVELMAKLREARDQVERLRGNGVWNGDWWCIRRDVYDAGLPNPSTVREAK